jgi:RimJ/RimL family protein N-acetyltransferase
VHVDLHALHDGRKVEIRPIRPDDAGRLREAHTRLSPETRYQRFLTAKPALSAADARYLVEVDGSDHFALVATARSGERPSADGSIVAVARFVRAATDPTTAEFAVVVGDEYQGQGLATGLLDRLACAARERGVRRFRATTLADNVPVHRLLRRLARGELTQSRRGAITEIKVELPTRIGERRSRAPAMIAACAGS